MSVRSSLLELTSLVHHIRLFMSAKIDSGENQHSLITLLRSSSPCLFTLRQERSKPQNYASQIREGSFARAAKIRSPTLTREISLKENLQENRIATTSTSTTAINHSEYPLGSE
jgi:hypothetical protein